MRSIFVISSFILVGLFTAILTGFGPFFVKQQHAYDDEQKGINQEIVIKFSHVVAENTPKGLAAQHFADLVKKETNGRVKIEVFSNSSLYSDQDELNALQANDVQMIAPAFSKLTSAVPEWAVFDLPFAFPTQQAVLNAISGNIGQTIFRKMDDKNMKVLSIWSNGFKQITNNSRPLLLPKDFQGLSFRIMPSNVIKTQFEAFHANPQIIPFNHTYQMLQKGSVDGQENTISNIYSKKFYQVQKYLTISDHGFLGYAVIINQKFWKTLPKNVQSTIQKAMLETTVWNQKNSVAINQEQLQKIRNSKSIQIHELTSSEKRVWIQQLEPVYQHFEPIIGKHILQQILKNRDNYLLHANNKS